MLKKILRNFQNDCPKDTLTGNETLDSLLITLDSKLVGSPKVRLLTLLEVKDHLLQGQKKYLEEGQSASQASNSAVTALGPVEDLARDQRKTLRRQFFRNFVSMTIYFAVCFYIINVLEERRKYHTDPIIYAAYMGLWMGLWMGFFTTYIHSGRSVPRNNTRPTDYVVKDTFSRGHKLLSIVFIAFLTIYGFRQAFITTSSTVITGPRILGLFMFVTGLWQMTIMYARAIKIYVNRDGFLIRLPFNKSQITWSQVLKISNLQERNDWKVHIFSYYRRVADIEYQTTSGNRKKFTIYPDMENSDHFIMDIRSKISAHH